VPRERKPLDEHKLQGTKPQYVDPSVDVMPSRPRYPADLTPAQKKVFKRMARLIERRRSLTEGDGDLIRLFAITYVRHEKAKAKVEEEGEIKVYFRLDNHGEQVPCEKRNLWLKIVQDCEKQMIGLHDRLGTTPLNRNKVKQVDPPKPKEDPLEAAMLSRSAPQPQSETEPDLDAVLKASEIIQ
jgi:P27 family predicted phage terminase small subunit